MANRHSLTSSVSSLLIGGASHRGLPSTAVSHDVAEAIAAGQTSRSRQYYSDLQSFAVRFEHALHHQAALHDHHKDETHATIRNLKKLVNGNFQLSQQVQRDQQEMRQHAAQLEEQLTTLHDQNLALAIQQDTLVQEVRMVMADIDATMSQWKREMAYHADFLSNCQCHSAQQRIEELEDAISDCMDHIVDLTGHFEDTHFKTSTSDVPSKTEDIFQERTSPSKLPASATVLQDKPDPPSNAPLRRSMRRKSAQASQTGKATPSRLKMARVKSCPPQGRGSLTTLLEAFEAMEE